MASNYLDGTGLALVWEKIKNALSAKVDKETGKVLSSNDYTSEEKSKLANVASGAQVNVLEGIQKNGTDVSVTNKIANISVPTKTSDITNDSGFITTTDLTTLNGRVEDLEDAVAPEGAVDTRIQNAILALDSSISETTNEAISSIVITDGKITSSTKTTIPINNNQLTNGAGYQTASDVNSAIDAALSDVTGINFEVVQTLPASGSHGTIYLVPKQASQGDIYDEYIWLTHSGGTAHWEQIGTTAIDLSDYWAKSELTAITSAQIDAILT